MRRKLEDLATPVVNSVGLVMLLGFFVIERVEELLKKPTE